MTQPLTSTNLLIENNAPLVVSPKLWKLEYANVHTNISEERAVSYIDQFETRIKNSDINESQRSELLESFKPLRESILNELTSKNKRLLVSGPAQIEDQKNGNGRIYPKNLWNRVLAPSAPFMERLNEGMVLGELEHPESGNTKLPRVSHQVKEVWRKDGIVYNKSMILKTPMGQIAEEIISSGIPLGQSSRGRGDTVKTSDGEVVETESYHLDTWDFVYQPSVAIAKLKEFNEPKVNENKPTVYFFPQPLTEKNNTEPSVIITPTTPILTENREDKEIMPTLTESQIRENVSLTNKATVAIEKTNAYLQTENLSLSGLLTCNTDLMESLSGIGAVTGDDYIAESAELKGTITALSRQVLSEVKRIEETREAEVKAELDAAKQLVNEAIKNGDNSKETTQLKEQLDNLSEINGQISERSNISEGLGNALIKRYKSDKKVYEMTIRKLAQAVRKERQKNKAAKQIISEMTGMYRKDKLTALQKEALRRYPTLDRIKDKLKECTTPKQIQTLIEAANLAPQQSYPQDLPNLNESVPSNRPASQNLNEARDLMDVI